MTERTVHHASFVIERNYDASAARVFSAFADPAAKMRWFANPGEWNREGYSLDFRVGGREHVVSRRPNRPAHTFDAVYHDIVPNERIIFSYEMHLDDKRISVSLTTVELKREGKGTRLIFTEQGAFLDGFDNPAERERGTKSLLEKLDAELRRNT